MFIQEREYDALIQRVSMAEWSKAPDSSSGPRKRAWVQIPLLTFLFFLPLSGINDDV